MEYSFANYRWLFAGVASDASLDLSARDHDRLARDGAGVLAAKPKHGIGDFRRRHKAALRIVPRQFSHSLLMTAAGFFHDVVEPAPTPTRPPEPGTYPTHRHP